MFNITRGCVNVLIHPLLVINDNIRFFVKHNIISLKYDKYSIDAHIL